MIALLLLIVLSDNAEIRVEIRQGGMTVPYYLTRASKRCHKESS